MQPAIHYYYRFSGLHSLLIGLLPFFLPVFVWQNTQSLSAVSLFIALTGTGFVAGLTGWDRLRFKHPLQRVVTVSFLLEIILVAAIYFGVDNWLSLSIVALINGIYNSFYWTTQRLFFSLATDKTNSGKVFGNFQILVIILLKVGILAGGFFLQSDSLLSLVLVSAALSLVAIRDSWKNLPDFQQPETKEPVLTLSNIIKFKDRHHSKFIFYLDGLFLYMESYFWLLSLYLISDESVSVLGLTVVLLMVILGALFYLIKNIIDRLNQPLFYAAAVVLYALSWFLRGHVSTQVSAIWVYSIILLVAFCTSFFRLAFNKRFFDLAKQQKTRHYLLIKSYYSQMTIAIFFAGLTLLMIHSVDVESWLQLIYWAICPLSLMYLIYAKKPYTVFSAKSKPDIATKPITENPVI